MLEIFTPEGLSARFAIIGIDLVLAGYNAIVIGLAAAGLRLARSHTRRASPGSSQRNQSSVSSASVI